MSPSSRETGQRRVVGYLCRWKGLVHVAQLLAVAALAVDTIALSLVKVLAEGPCCHSLAKVDRGLYSASSWLFLP